MLKRQKLIEKHSTQGYFVTSDLLYISKVRQDTANSILSTFLQNMHQIGYSYKNICALVRKS
ncbi:hypothetical protein [Clostridium sp. CF011]|nr:hypothetical protein [Clostridium sp. CF011]